MPKNKSGFTIVELLIVIVVIAILAAITIVAYNGIQNRAEASKTTTAVQAYKKALALYKVDNGTYPAVGAMCLGDKYPNPTFTGGTGAQCRYSTSPIGVASNVAARDMLKPYLGGSLPMPSSKVIDSGSTEYVGAHFYGSAYNYTLDGKPIVMIEYYIYGDTCPVGPVYANTPPTYVSPASNRSAAIGTVGSRCFLPLAND